MNNSCPDMVWGPTGVTGRKGGWDNFGTPHTKGRKGLPFDSRSLELLNVDWYLFSLSVLNLDAEHWDAESKKNVILSEKLMDHLKGRLHSPRSSTRFWSPSVTFQLQYSVLRTICDWSLTSPSKTPCPRKGSGPFLFWFLERWTLGPRDTLTEYAVCKELVEESRSGPRPYVLHTLSFTGA